MVDPEPSRFNIVLGQRMSWPDMLARARETEALGFDGFYLVDHFFGLKDVNDPTHEAYTMLAGLAPFTQQMRLGVMVCGNTYRNPAFLLKQAISVDHISGGRVDFGVGAGWAEREHEAYGFPFPPAKERVDRFAEALEIWDLLQSQERTTYDGTYYQIADAPFEPKSLQSPRLPLLIGGSGPRMLRLIARQADIWNMVGTPEELGAASTRLDAACAEVGRDPATLVRSVSPSINLLASPQAFEDGVAAYREAGIRDISFPWPRVESEVPVLREVARSVIPWLRGEHAPAPPEYRPSLADPLGDPGTATAVIDALDRAQLDLLANLATRVGEVVEGSDLARLAGLDSQRALTRALAGIAERFAVEGLRRPWIETQRGYVLPADAAALLNEARRVDTGSTPTASPATP